MLRETAPYRFEIHASLRDFVYNHMNADERSKWHSVAADHYLRSGEPLERLVHLLKANRRLEAEMLIGRVHEDIITRGDAARLWQALQGFEASKPKYRPGVVLARARLADLLEKSQAAWELLEGLSGDDDSSVKSEALTEMGMIREGQSRLDEAYALFEDAVSLASDASVRARALRGLGAVQCRKGDLSKAEELFERSAKDALTAMDQEGARRAQLALGAVLLETKRYGEAIDHFSKCATGLASVDLAGAYLSMGVAYLGLDMHDDAIELLMNAVRLSGETGQPRVRAHAHNALSEALTRSDRPGEGREHCYEALEVFTELGDSVGMSVAYANLAMAERSLGNARASEENLAESVKVLESPDASPETPPSGMDPMWPFPRRCGPDGATARVEGAAAERR